MGSMSTNSVGLAFIPAPLPGHLVSTIKFATQLLERHPGFSITILIIKPTFGPPPPTSSPHESIHFVVLPEVEPPPHELIKECIEHYLSDYTTSHRSHIKDAIINSGAPTAAIFFDLFSVQTVDVAKELGLPAYLFYTSGAAFFGLTLHLPDRHDRVGAPFSGTDPDEIIPSFKSPFPPRFIPQFLHTNLGYATTLSAGKRFREVKAIITNTFDDLEPYAVESLRQDARNPPIYSVGPILDLVGQAHIKAHKDQHEKIIKWLNDQPESSVVFLCFGTAGSMQEAQAREVALGLINSGARFLWAVRKPPSEGHTGPPTGYTAEDLKELLPELGPVLEKGQGIICGWVPQAEVLANNAILGFVSHCGWNSILESLWFGRPIVAWPMYAEQQSNSFQLVRDLGLAVELRLHYDMDSGDLVVADELEKAINSLSDPNNDVHAKAKDMAEKSRKAVAEGGSSYNFIGQLIDEILTHK